MSARSNPCSPWFAAGCSPEPPERTPDRPSGIDRDGDRADPTIADIAPYCVSPDTPLRKVIDRIDLQADGLALVVDGDRRLIATVTDGDIRRAMLAGVDLETPVRDLPRAHTQKRQGHPITAPRDTSTVQLLRLMGEHAILHVPLLDGDGRVVALASLNRFVRGHDLPLRAVIMAGGLGTRLRPLTNKMPKPMLPVGGRPLLERTVEQLRDVGIKQIHITTHYKADKITEHFGDGSSFDAIVHYSYEDQPLGTAGSLKMMDAVGDKPLLVLNGDILTKVNYRAMLNYHREHRAQLTMGVRRYAIKVPYGVVECDGPVVRELREKPEVGFFVNAGIYLVEPHVCRCIPAGCFHMTDLIALIIARGGRVASFPIHEYWLDIGRLEDYERAQEDAYAGKI